MSFKKKIAIIHFSPIEKYPPVLNDINTIDKLNPNYFCKVFTSYTKNKWFQTKKVKLIRIGFDVSENNDLIRYLQYFWFNIYAFYQLVLFKPDKIIGYETLSVQPIFLYSLINRNFSKHLHYHEYISKPEILKASKYFKFLHSLESKLWKDPSVKISHTNEDRRSLYLNDFPFVKFNQVEVYPNFPPENWYSNSKQSKNSQGIDKHPIRFIHVGALGIDSMYVLEIVNWIISHKGKFELDFYITNTTSETKTYLDYITKIHKFIRVKNPIQYYDLPKILINYDVGLVLYKGNIPNHTFSVPNKVFEYLACGLEVWYSNKLISTSKFVEKEKIQRCFQTNFEELDNLQRKHISLFNDNIFFERLHYEQKI